ncbi:MAG: hypothetical protein CMN73_13700 [Sphingomonas sp.]|nr:hypothetical protein [Sphingomonas sp.]|tara:strand:- start:703 stop:1539 length:837 start_codon:yes stop_codon:yes gene_type:complete
MIFPIRNRATGVACAIAATMLGLAYLAMAGAPDRYLIVNGTALLIGLAMMGAVARGWRGLTPMVVVAIGGIIAALLLATSVAGVHVDGATRWVAIGPLILQPALILLPLLILAFAHLPGRAMLAIIVIAAAAIALQPDRQCAGALCAATVVLALITRDQTHRLAAIGTGLAFAVTLWRPDSVPPVPMVERVLYDAFDIGPAAGLAVWIGVALLPLPALAVHSESQARGAAAAFAAFWIGVVLAALLGNYPTPLVGYGASAILGYLIGLPWLNRSPLER